MVDETFLNETRMSEKTEFDITIKLWMRYVPDWKALHPTDLSEYSVIIVTDL